MQRGEKMVEEQDVRLTYFHKYIGNPSIHGTICTENLLNADRKPQEVKDLYAENLKTLIKETEEDSKWKKERYSTPLGQKN